jgi:putative isomerase
MAGEGAWNTWEAEHPACVVHPTSGFCVRLSAFGTSAGRYSDLPFDAASMRLGSHATDGSFAELELAHAGARLRVRFAHAERDCVVGDVEVLETAEWALRYWFVLAAGCHETLAHVPGRLRLEVGGDGDRYVEPPVSVGKAGESWMAFTTSLVPVGAHLYEDRSDARVEFEERGYYARPPRREGGRWALFRFSAVTPRIGFAAAVGEDEGSAVRAARTSIASWDETIRERSRELGTGGDRAAIRDVLAWNTAFDPVNLRPYTAATRGWVSRKFGGWIVWQVDAFFHALMAAEIGDRSIAVADLQAALSLATEHGNLAALASGVTRWDDRSHPPIGALAIWWAHRRLDLAELLERAFPILNRAHSWWFANRDGNRNGLLEYGSSPVGDGHFVHSKLAAMNESAMDNSPVHDEAEFRPERHTLDVEDVGLNSLLVLDGELLARMAEELGEMTEASRLREEAVRLAELVRDRLWDEERMIFANRLWDGRFTRSVSPTSAYPMLAGIATTEQATAFVHDHLLSPRRFWGPWPVAGTPHDDPAAAESVYWRGRLWPPFNFLVYLALRRYGLRDAATELAERGGTLFRRHWDDRRSYENLDQRTGEGGDSPDSDPFYSWGALLPTIALLDARGVDPWVDPLDLRPPSDEGHSLT